MTPPSPPSAPPPPLTTTFPSRVRLGICAMDKKARSKPMSEILSRLDDSQFQIIFFGDDLILHAPVASWPVCDVLIAFHSGNYPLDKAEEYVAIHSPILLNDLRMQRILMDRRKVYDLLEESGIDVPRHVYVSRDNFVSTGTGAGDRSGSTELVEHDDHIEINGVTIHKPFVEKPVNADDHNIAIYYPQSAGGGCKKLFRKIGDRSSEFYPDINNVRRKGSYIYEEFVETQGTDVKMYTVGPDYGHAEARKSPTIDGKVERNSDGKEVRFPVILTLREKEIARRIVMVFKQQVCGFDLLRVQEDDSLVSYVCDVNGWSFVKNSRKYYEDCAQILTEHILATARPKWFRCFSAVNPLMKMSLDAETVKKTGKGSAHRHVGSDGDQHNFIEQEDDDVTEAVRMVGGRPASLSKMEDMVAATTLKEGAFPVRDIPDALAQEPASLTPSKASSVDDEGDNNMSNGGGGGGGGDGTSNGTTGGHHRHISETMSSEDDNNNNKTPAVHQEELRCVIAVVRHGDRTPKQKLKMNTREPHILDYFHKNSNNPKKDLKVKDRAPMVNFLNTVKLMIDEKKNEDPKKQRDDDTLYKLMHMRDVLERWTIGGLNRKLQLKPRQWSNDTTPCSCTEVQLILKWGGNLTKLGERQSITLGQKLRHVLYPDAPGGGILRLHSTFRHDLKIKTSDEGRVMKTAAAFAKGLLELEGEIPPILVSLVHKEKDSLHMLDPSGNKEVKKELERCKNDINRNLQQDVNVDTLTVAQKTTMIGPLTCRSQHHAFRKIHNPRATLFRIWNLIGELLSQLDEMLGHLLSGDEDRNEGGEGLITAKCNEESLSGIKLYKGETLLELTERWRFIYQKLYDDDADTFDLSRIPDVHDNVRFDMLHNPHLGLTATLEKLYELGKLMADCVVPQEYGTSVEEKRSIGSKMCRALLEKIKYDLIIARTDNQTDMRYMINMDYSADLPINTLGRRIRTRLYFTSESHLHTLINVLRFSTDDPNVNSKGCLLSHKGREVINETSELCYLTQIIIRLFEDTKKDMSDPKRFRVEILFSPGATATPLHMAEMYRDMDTSRFDTDSLEVISREGLSCNDVEDYFDETIVRGRTDEDEDEDGGGGGGEEGDVKSMVEKQSKKGDFDRERVEKMRKKLVEGDVGTKAAGSGGADVATTVDIVSKKTLLSRDTLDSSFTGGETDNDDGGGGVSIVNSGGGGDGSKEIPETMTTTMTAMTMSTTTTTTTTCHDASSNDNNNYNNSSRRLTSSPPPPIINTNHTNNSNNSNINDKNDNSNNNDDDDDDDDDAIVDKEKVERLARLLAKRYLTRALATATFVLGVACLVLANRIRNENRSSGSHGRGRWK